MNFDLYPILESKRALHRDLARRSVAEKLAMLDILRDRVRLIRQAGRRMKGTEESPSDHRAQA